MVGAGVVGCYVGGRLAAAGLPVTLIGRARIGDAIRNHGLTLSDHRGYRAQCAPGALRSTRTWPRRPTRRSCSSR
ncbi:hypothetical protein WL11_08555 [Burkholderia ubonensis]|nr:hypothetical protein WL11_08555 [Burkholderia ubonensis]